MKTFNGMIALILSRRRPLSYRNQSIVLGSKSMDWFLYDNGLRLERVNNNKREHWEKRVNRQNHKRLTAVNPSSPNPARREKNKNENKYLT